MEEIVKPLRGYSEERIFYVYFHKRPDGTIFYVGKGHGNRAWVKKSRNNHWNNVVNKHKGFDVEIVADNLTEQEAFAKERELILEIGMDNLTNQTLGGISTTGYQHTEETIALQREIANKRLENNPELRSKLQNRLSELHHKQRYDIEYKEMMAQKQRDFYNSLSVEEKKARAEKRNEWRRDPSKKEAVLDKMRITNSTPERKEALSKQMKEVWANMSDEERAEKAKRSSDVINDPKLRAKLVELASHKLVVNRMFVFKSKISFLEHIGAFHAPLAKAFSIGKNKFNFNFGVYLSYLVEEYSEEIHSEIKDWEGEDVPKLNFECLPKSKAIVMDESRVFLSMREASIFCNGKTIEATADFITKNMKRNKPAMGHNWRTATNEEIKTEVFRRVEELKEKHNV